MGNYISAYSGKSRDERATARVGFYYMPNMNRILEDMGYLSERMMIVKLNFKGIVLQVLSVY